MTYNREISKLGEYITIDPATNTIDFGEAIIANVGIGTTSNVNTSGIVTASFFYGNGSNLTNIIGVGAGVEIRNNGTPVGTASTLDFLSGVNFSFSSGIGTISSTGVNVRSSGSPLGVANTINFGSNLTASYSAGIVTVSSSGGSGFVPNRTVVSGSTGSIAANASSNIQITGFKSYCLLKAQVSVPAWVTLYTDTTSRTNDASRLITQDPIAGSGVIAEFITTTNSETVLFTPTSIGFNNDNVVTDNIYLKVQNRSGVTASVSVSLTIIQLEA
jgi:hypothetical protein